MSTVEVYKPKNHIRFVTASSLFDGMMHPLILCVEFYSQAGQK